MSQPLPLILLASLAAGGAGAAVATIAMPRAQTAATEDGTVSRMDADVFDQLRALNERMGELTERVDAFESRSSLAPISTGAPRIAADGTDLEEAVRAVLDRLPESSTVGNAAISPGLETAIEQVMDMREERERFEREQSRAEAQAKRIEDRLARIQSELGLDQNQVNSMREIYQTSDTRREEVRSEMRQVRESGGSWEDVRALMTTARDETNAAIQNVLTPAQYESYQESYSDDRFRGRGGPDRGGNGGGGTTDGGDRGGRTRRR